MKTLLKDLFEAAGIKPVRDAQAQWLRKHRPSVALLCCLGSGPWRLPRRTAVQANAIALLGDRDLAEIERHEIPEFFPLKWQRDYLKAAILYTRMLQYNDFDTNLRPGTGSRARDCYAYIWSIHCKYHKYHSGVRGGALIKPLPKVLGMFVRDFIMLDAFPIDRHVKKWLKENKLPTNHLKLMAMFEAEKLHARYYARALFLDKSKNPVHKPTVRR